MYRGNRPPHRHMVEYIVLFHAPRQKTAAFAYRVDFHSFMTRPLGVRVDGPTGRRLWPADAGGLCSHALKGRQPYRAEGDGLDCPAGNEYKVSVTGMPSRRTRHSEPQAKDLRTRRH